jgi:hypothetical protein
MSDRTTRGISMFSLVSWIKGSHCTRPTDAGIWDTKKFLVKTRFHSFLTQSKTNACHFHPWVRIISSPKLLNRFWLNLVPEVCRKYSRKNGSQERFPKNEVVLKFVLVLNVFRRIDFGWYKHWEETESKARMKGSARRSPWHFSSHNPNTSECKRTKTCQNNGEIKQ